MQIQISKVVITYVKNLFKKPQATKNFQKNKNYKLNNFNNKINNINNNYKKKIKQLMNYNNNFKLIKIVRNNNKIQKKS